MLSSTNAVPLLIDEYKPWEMPRHIVDMLHALLRQLYSEEDEHRGTADQKVNVYPLKAPVCLSGEGRPSQAALLERMVPVAMSKSVLESDPKFKATFKHLHDLDLNLLARPYIQFTLSVDFDAALADAVKRTDALIGLRKIPMRVRDNLIVTVLGTIFFENFAAGMKVSLPALDRQCMADAIIETVAPSGVVQDGLDAFIEAVSVMASTCEIQHGQHYIIDGPEGAECLCVKLRESRLAYPAFARKTEWPKEVPDYGALRDLVKENNRRGVYVVEINKQVGFPVRPGMNRNRPRCVVIDLAMAEKHGLELEEFPRGMEGERDDAHDV
jgi:hypothetical protein